MRLQLAVALLSSATLAIAAGSDPVPTPKAPAAATTARTAEKAFNDGLTRKKAGQWREAEASFREATQLKPDFAAAWSELGHALKKRGLYDDSVQAYQEALRLRPDFPQAIEYLGETYALMGKRAEAQQMLDHLRPLDAKLAAQLEAGMKGGGSGY